MEIVSSKAITISVLTIIIIIIICCALCQSTWIYYILLLSRVRIVLNNNWLLIAFIKKKKNYCGRLAAAATYVNTKYIPRKTGISSYSFVHSNEHNRKPYPYDRTARFSFIEINCVCVCGHSHLETITRAFSYTYMHFIFLHNLAGNYYCSIQSNNNFFLIQMPRRPRESIFKWNWNAKKKNIIKLFIIIFFFKFIFSEDKFNEHRNPNTFM